MSSGILQINFLIIDNNVTWKLSNKLFSTVHCIHDCQFLLWCGFLCVMYSGASYKIIFGQGTKLQIIPSKNISSLKYILSLIMEVKDVFFFITT